MNYPAVSAMLVGDASPGRKSFWVGKLFFCTTLYVVDSLDFRVIMIIVETNIKFNALNGGFL